MKAYKVEYRRVDWHAYFMGSYECHKTTEEYFLTEEKAQDFINSEVKEYMPTWEKDVVVKETGVGKIVEIVLN